MASLVNNYSKKKKHVNITPNKINFKTKNLNLFILLTKFLNEMTILLLLVLNKEG